MRGLMIAAVLAVASCGQSATTAPASTQVEAPAQANVATAAAPATSRRDMLIDCTGAIAAAGDVDPLGDLSANTSEVNNLYVVLELMEREPGLEGTEGRRQAAAARARWETRPQAETQARADACGVQLSSGGYDGG